MLVDGRQARSTDLQPGEDAQIAYQVSGAQPTAMVIQVASGNPQTGSSRTQGDSAGQGTGAGPASPDEASAGAGGQ